MSWLCKQVRSFTWQRLHAGATLLRTATSSFAWRGCQCTGRSLEGALKGKLALILRHRLLACLAQMRERFREVWNYVSAQSRWEFPRAALILRAPPRITCIAAFTRWFRYDRDKLWLVYTQSVPVIFEPPCIINSVLFTEYIVKFLLINSARIW
jgi:hypothetical protein